MGERRIINGAIYERTPDGQIVLVGPAEPAAAAVPNAVPLPVNPVRAAREAQEAARREAADARAEAAANRSAAAAERSADNTERTNERQSRNDNFTQVRGLANDYNADITVRAFRVALQQLSQALSTGEGPQADLALTYAFAKAMDPESVVRESEQGMVTASQPWFRAQVERARREFGVGGAGSFTPETRDALRRQILNSVSQRRQVYDARREYFRRQAEALGVDPDLVIGRHDHEPFLPAIREFQDRQRANAQDGEAAAPDEVLEDGSRVVTNPDGSKTAILPDGTERLLVDVVGGQPPDPGTYEGSPVGQTLSGVNEGIAGALGAPVDLATAALNLVPRGINALANTDIPTIENPILGSDWLRDRMAGWAIHGQTNDPRLQFARRIAESVGAAALPAGAAGTLGRAGANLLAGAGGGTGAAVAQQLAPGNVLAEMGGELLGGGATGYGIARRAQRGAQRAIEAEIPTTDELRQQAGEIYRRAEARGVTATPDRTEDLADILRQTLRDEGQLGPAGRISDADTAATRALNLVEQYEGQQMRPTEMDTIRRVIADSRNSPEPSDRRLGNILLEQFDDWVRPLAPDFDEARAVSSRYLQAEDLEQARELARARAPQFSASGLENALRTEYRALDRNAVRGRQWFDPHVQEAVQNVARGTPASNFARNLGRFAPTGPVSAAATLGLPTALGTAVAGGPAGLALGATAGALGYGGRHAATSLGLRNADIAELTARNGGPIPQAPLIPDVFRDQAARLAAIEYAKYLAERPQQ